MLRTEDCTRKGGPPGGNLATYHETHAWEKPGSRGGKVGEAKAGKKTGGKKNKKKKKNPIIPEDTTKRVNVSWRESLFSLRSQGMGGKSSESKRSQSNS